MNKKKILFLGGAPAQVPAIKYAKEMGYCVITADFLPSNPGHRISNEYHNVSTVDKEKVLELCTQIGIDAITAYASDPAAPTAAYVSEKLKLVGSSYKSVMTLSDKILFRQFLKEKGYKTPWFIHGSMLRTILKQYPGEKAILKPVDSSGSKGIYVINDVHDLETNFSKAIGYSRSGKVILEEYIDRKGRQIHGEGFVIDGKIIFLLLGDQVFSTVNEVVPYSTVVPSHDHHDIMHKVHELIESAIKDVGFNTGGINVEVIRDKNDELYILEIGARNGGNFMPQLMKRATGFDLIKANIDALFNIPVLQNKGALPDKYYAQVILHSKTDGILTGINIPEEFKRDILEYHVYYEPGHSISKYRNSKDVVGVLILGFSEPVYLKIFKTAIIENNWVVTV